MIKVIITSSFLIIIILVLRTLLKGKISCRIQYALWLLVVIRLLIPVNLIKSDFSVINFIVDKPEVKTSSIEEIDEPMQYAIVDSPLSNLKNSEPNNQVTSIDYNNMKLLRILFSEIPIKHIIFSVWAMGFIVFSIIFLVTNLIFWRNLKRERIYLLQVKERLPVCLVKNIPSPCLFGLFSPKIYVTQEALQKNKLNYVLAHEMQHYKHFDYLWSVIREICLALYWFNPFVWIAAIVSKQDCELACDEGTIMTLGEQERINYGRTLIELATISRTNYKLENIAVMMSENYNCFKERIVRISKRPKISVRYTAILFIVIVIAMVSTFSGTKGTVDSYVYGNSFRGYFSEGLAAVIKYNNDGVKGGYIDKSGKEVIPFIYDDHKAFNEGLASVGKDNKYGYIDKEGKEIIPLIYDEANIFSSGLAAVRKGHKWGYIDKNGKEIIPFIYDYGWEFTEGLAAVDKGGKWGYINAIGEEVIPFIYDEAYLFSEELAPVKKGDKWGYIDKNGKEVITFKYGHAREVSDGLAAVEYNGKWGCIDKTGKQIIPFNYGNARQFSEGLIPVEMNLKWGYIDKTGKQIIPFIYLDAEHFTEKLAIVCKDGKPQYIKLPTEIANKIS